MFQWLTITAIVSQQWINNTPTSFHSLIESLLYGGHVKGWVKPEKVHTHATLWLLASLSAESTYRAMTLVLYSA